MDPFGAVQQFGRAGEVSVGLLHPRPAEQGLEDGRVQPDGLLVEPARLLHPPLVLQVPGEVGEHDRIGSPQKLQHASVVMLARLRPVGLGQDHAHQVVRLHVRRREAHGVARVDLGLVQRALLEQPHGQGLGGGEVVGGDPQEPPEQRLGGGGPALARAQIREQAERRRIRGEGLQMLDQPALGVDQVACGHGASRARKRSGGTCGERRERPVERTAPVGAQAAQARTGRGGRCRRGGHRRALPAGASAGKGGDLAKIPP